MKLEPHSTSSAVGSHRLLLALVCLLPLFALAAPPSWWTDRQVLDSNATKNDYGPANQGQLKSIATKAYAELQAKLPASTWNSPQGQALSTLINSWNVAQGGNYALVNQGQLKAVAKTFYDVLIQAGYASAYPWTDTTADDANYAPANIGQVKNVFAFDLGSSVVDSDGNGLPDNWEITYFGQIGADASADPDGDGFTNLQEYQNGTSPIDYYNGQAPVLTKISGDNQQSAPNTFLPLPLVVKVTDGAGQLLNNAPVTFAVADGGGLLGTSPGGATAISVQTRTGSDGMVGAFYLQSPNPGVTSHINAGAAAAQVTFIASTDNGQPQGLTIVPGDVNATVNADANSLLPLTLTNNTSDTVTYAVGLEGDTIQVPNYTDSDQLGGPVFVWNDISATGTRLDGISDADDAIEAVSLSFPVPYFGSTYSDVFVSSNGFVTLGTSGGSYDYYQLPDPSAPANEIAAFHTDLYLDESNGGSGDVYFQDFGDHAIFQFSHAARIAQDGFSTFQIVLNADGAILFYYLEMTGTLDDCVVGLQNESKDKGLTVAYQQAYLKNNLAVRLVDSTRWLTVSPTSGSLTPGESTTLNALLDARGLATGGYNGGVAISADSAPDLSLTVPVAMNINSGPEVTVTSPEEGWLFAEATEAVLQASAFDQDGVSKVEFYDGSVKLGEATAAPYTFTWQNIPFGTHIITALAVDSLGAVRRSPPVRMEVQADTNHNGIGDDWEMYYFGNLDQTASGDFDQDGLTNAEEWALRANPILADSDGDGVSDGDEAHIYHTDLNETDSDGDGLSDGWEISHGLDPVQDDSQLDSDGDGLTNAEELALGTAPDNPDTDGDGALDGADGWPLHPQLAPARLPATRYAVIDLGEGYASALNNHGDVVGEKGLTPAEAMLWKIGQPPLALGYLTEDTSAYRVSLAAAINDDGIIVGRATYTWNPDLTATYPNPPIYNRLATQHDSPEHNEWWDTHAFRWTAGVMTDLNDLTYGQHGNGTFPDASNKGSSEAASINQAGLIVGDSDSSVEVSNVTWNWEIFSSYQHAARFEGGFPVDLGLAPPRSEGGGAGARVINDLGSIVGFRSGSGINSGNGGFFYADGQMEILPFVVSGLNNLDQVVGSKSQDNRFLATMWVNQPSLPGVDRFVDLDAIARSAGFVSSSFASTIGDRGEIVGQATVREGGYFVSAVPIWRNGQAGNLGSLLGDPAWTLESAAAINSTGMIAATGTNSANPSERRALLLLPVELMVDGNRDGQMSFDNASIHDRDGTTVERPYRFWLNNDQDGTEEDFSPSPPDYVLDTLMNKRGLEDFTRIWVNLKGLTEMVKTNGAQLQLEWKPSDGGIDWSVEDNPSIKVFQAVEADGGRRYVEEEAVADQQLALPYRLALGQVGRETGALTLPLSAEILAGLSENTPNLYFLFEGTSVGKGRLVLSLINNGQKLCQYAPIYLDIRDIKNLYERWTVDPVADVPASGANPLGAAVISTRALPTGQTSGFTYDAQSPEEEKCIVFAHGWNLDPTSKDVGAETAYKRLWWQGYKGRFVTFQWPTTYGFGEDDLDAWWDLLTNRENYDEGELIAWRSAPALANLLKQLNAQCPNQVYLMGHSMGNVVAGEALRLLGHANMSINTYVASEGAIESECYDPSKATAFPLNYRYRGLFWDSGTPNIYSNWLTLNTSGVGNKVNFYNVNDYALSPTVWELNQISKPDSGGLLKAWGWGPPGRSGTGDDLFWRQNFFLAPCNPLNLGSAENVQDRYEIMAHAAEPHAQALGRVSDPVAGFAGTSDLQLMWGSDPHNKQFSDRDWHSGQFNFTNMQVKDFWSSLLDAFGLPTQP